MTDIRMYDAINRRTLEEITSRFDADSDVDGEQMTHFDPYAELAAHMTHLQRTQEQLAEAMTMCAELSADIERLTAERDSLRARYETINANHAERYAELQRVTAELERQQDMTTHAIQAWRELMAERNQLHVERDRLEAERDEANRRADDAVAAYHVIAARMGGMGWWL